MILKKGSSMNKYYKNNYKSSPSNNTVNLIYLPYAGGGSHYYDNISAALKSIQTTAFKIEIFEVVLPGRVSRYQEPLLKTMEDQVTDIWKQIKHLTNQPYAIFGHSMGSLLAYLCTHRAITMGNPTPISLFLSGLKAPSCLSLNQNHLLSYQDFKAKLASYGGINQEILNDDSIFSFFEPMIRSDFEAVETWKYHTQPKLNIPTTVLAGTEEDFTEDELKAWQKEFQNDLNFIRFEGGHFYINNHSQKIAQIIQEQIQKQLFAPIYEER